MYNFRFLREIVIIKVTGYNFNFVRAIINLYTKHWAVSAEHFGIRQTDRLH